MPRFVPPRATLTTVKKIAIVLVLALLCVLIMSGSKEAFAATNVSKARQGPLKSEKAESNLQFSGSLMQSKPQREEKDAMTLVNVTGEFRFEKRAATESAIGTSWDYVHTWLEESEDETSSQFESVIFYVNRTHKINPEGSSFQYALKLGLPANKADSIAGLNETVGIPLTFNMKLGSQNFITAFEPVFYNYRFETAQPLGAEYNKKISGLFALKLLSHLTERFSWMNSITWFNDLNYAGTYYQTYSLASFLQFKISENFAVLGGVSSHDRVITTNSVLADDTTSTRVGIEWNF